MTADARHGKCAARRPMTAAKPPMLPGQRHTLLAIFALPADMPRPLHFFQRDEMLFDMLSSAAGY